MQRQGPVPHLSVGGVGPVLHFSHANGFPPLAYTSLIEALKKEHQLIASLHRPLWADSHADMPDWQVLGGDILCLLETQPAPVISVGHSMGASALVMAAVRRPELFAGLVLIEPVLVRPLYTGLLRCLRPLARRLVPLIRATLNRVDSWPDREAVFSHFRGKSVFSRIGDTELWHYVEHGTAATADGRCRLVYSKEWEAHCYARIFNLWSILGQLNVPVLAIRGESSDTLSQQQWQRWQVAHAHDFVQMPDVGHLLPLEQPQALAGLISQWRNSQFQSPRG